MKLLTITLATALTGLTLGAIAFAILPHIADTTP